MIFTITTWYQFVYVKMARTGQNLKKNCRLGPNLSKFGNQPGRGHPDEPTRPGRNKKD